MSVDWSMAGRWTIAAFTSDGRTYHEGPAGTATDPGWDRVIAADYGSVVIAERYVEYGPHIDDDGLLYFDNNGHSGSIYRRERRVRTWAECDRCRGSGYDEHGVAWLNRLHNPCQCEGVGFLWVESSQG